MLELRLVALKLKNLRANSVFRAGKASSLVAPVALAPVILETGRRKAKQLLGLHEEL